MIANSLFAFAMPGLPEMLIIAFLVLLLFGGAKLPGLMKNMGRSIKEFKSGINEDPSKIESDDDIP